MLPGIMGSLQANEAVKLLAGIGQPLKGELLIFEALATRTRRIAIPKDPAHPGIDELIDYEAFCGIEGDDGGKQVPSMAPSELKAMRERGDTHTLIDVREPGEREIVSIGGMEIPLDRIPEEVSRIPEKGPIILYCRSGKRSAKAAREILDQRPESEIYNLRGGILAWTEEVDPSLPRY